MHGHVNAFDSRNTYFITVGESSANYKKPKHIAEILSSNNLSLQ